MYTYIYIYTCKYATIFILNGSKNICGTWVQRPRVVVPGTAAAWLQPVGRRPAMVKPSGIYGFEVVNIRKP